jgi:hypothetical protein
MTIRPLVAASVTSVALLLTAGGALLAPAAVASTIYEWTLNGQKFASDRPPPPGAKLIRVQQDHNSGTAAKPAPQPAAAAANSAAAVNAANDAATARQVQQDLNKTQSDLCNDARERYQSYLTAQRLFKPGPNQERQYLTDAELTSVRVNAKRDMDTACKPQ